MNDWLLFRNTFLCYKGRVRRLHNPNHRELHGWVNGTTKNQNQLQTNKQSNAKKLQTKKRTVTQRTKNETELIYSTPLAYMRQKTKELDRPVNRINILCHQNIDRASLQCFVCLPHWLSHLLTWNNFEKVTKHVFIFDLEGFSFSMATHTPTLDILQRLITIYEGLHYDIIFFIYICDEVRGWELISFKRLSWTKVCQLRSRIRNFNVNLNWWQIQKSIMNTCRHNEDGASIILSNDKNGDIVTFSELPGDPESSIRVERSKSLPDRLQDCQGDNKDWN